VRRARHEHPELDHRRACALAGRSTVEKRRRRRELSRADGTGPASNVSTKWACGPSHAFWMLRHLPLKNTVTVTTDPRAECRSLLGEVRARDADDARYVVHADFIKREHSTKNLVVAA